MKFTCERDALRTLAATADRVASKADIPHLQRIGLEIRDGRLHARATDLTSVVESSIQVTVERPGEVCLPSRLFAENVAAIPSSSHVSVDVDSQCHAQIVGKARRFQMPGARIDVLPTLPTQPTDGWCSLPSPLVRTLLREGAWARADPKGDKADWACAWIVGDASEIRCVATNNYCMSVSIQAHARTRSTPLHVQLPDKAVTELLRLIETTGVEAVEIAERHPYVFLRVGDTTFSTRLLDRQVLPWEQFVRNVSADKSRAVANRQDLLDAVNSVARLNAGVDEKQFSHGIEFRVTETAIEIRSEHSDRGSGYAVVEATLDGAPETIGLNGRFLASAIAAYDTDLVMVCASDPFDPLYVRPAIAGARSFSIVMPKRLGS